MITPIMIEDTIREMATKAIRTRDIVLMMSVTDFIMVATRSV